LTSNITAGLLISYGDRKIRKKDVMERQLRQALTEEAMKRKEIERRIQSRQGTEHEELIAKEGLKSLKKESDSKARLASGPSDLPPPVPM
jgi:hypothetical protein